MGTTKRHRRGFRESLDEDQFLWLIIGGPGPLAGVFRDENEASELYWKHRAWLMESVTFLTRPEGFWRFESPERKAPHERDSTALLRLNLPLTLREHCELENEQAPAIPSEIPAGAAEFWKATAHALRIRALWHEKEDRGQQAAAWTERAEELEKLLRIKETQ